jgi:hypothetical protein
MSTPDALCATSRALLTALHAWRDDQSSSCDDETVLAALQEACAAAQQRLDAEQSFRKRPRSPPKLHDVNGWALVAPTAVRPDPGTCSPAPNFRAAREGPSRTGELVLLGSGLRAMCHLTREAMCHLRAADVVFGALQPGGPDRRWLELALGRPVVDLNQFYPTSLHANRAAAYIQGAEAALRVLRRGERACVIE